MKNLFIALFTSITLFSGGCGLLDSIDEAEPCMEALRTSIPVFSTQDLAPCSEIKSINFKDESISEDSRHLSYDLIDASNSKFSEYLDVSEFTTCAAANLYYNLLSNASSDVASDNPKTPSTLSKLYDEAHLTYRVDDESLREIVGRLDNIVVVFGLDFLECSNDWDASVELFNNIGERVGQ